jgi:hypothetical protein
LNELAQDEEKAGTLEESKERNLFDEQRTNRPDDGSIHKRMINGSAL